MAANADEPTQLSFAAKIAIAVMLCEQTFLFLADDYSRFKILFWMNALALGVTLLVMAMVKQLSELRRRFVIFYAAVLAVFLVITLLGARGADYLLIDNSSSAAVEISFDGKPLGTLPGHTYAELPARVGAHQLTATDSSGRKIEDVDFTLRRAGLIARLRVIYNLGGLAQYAAVTFDYRNQDHERVVPLPPQKASHLVLLHQTFEGDEPEIDQSFALSIQVKSSDSTRRTHLCHFLSGGFHGCDNRADKSRKVKL